MIKKVLFFVMSGLAATVILTGILMMFFMTSKECSSLTNSEASRMILNIFEDKLKRADDGLIVFKLDPAQLVISEIKRELGTEDSLGYIDILYHDRKTGNLKLTAAIYDNCEIQWIKGR